MTDIPLSVWPTAQQTAAVQRADRYLPVSRTHPAKMLPAIARTAIAAYTQPGDLVIDPMCGIGTTLVEAVHLGRHAIGVEYEPDWARLAADNLHHAHSQGAAGHGRVVTGDARKLATHFDPGLHGTVALIFTSPPYGPSLHGQVTPRPGHGIHKSHYKYSTDRSNLGNGSLTRLLAAMHDMFTGSLQLLRPGGYLAMTVRPWWHAGALIDLPGALVCVAESAGLTLYERNVELLAGLRDDRLIPRASFFALDQVRRARHNGIPRLVIAHEDLLVFQSPRSSLGSGKPKGSPPVPLCQGVSVAG